MIQSNPVTSSGIKNYKMFFRLATHANIVTLKEIIGKIKTPWQKRSLKLVRKSETTRLTKTSVYVSGFGSKFEAVHMLEVFGREN